MSPTVFIDGDSGTTGLQIRARLEGRDDVTLIRLPDAERKDAARRRQAINDADVVILCLPDDAAREAVSLIENARTRVIDASTAHRTADGWVYGMPEYDDDQRAAIAAAARVTNPGCYAVSAIAILHPLVARGLLPADFPATINAISGYSGGGKRLIADFEDTASAEYTDVAYRVYALGLDHKHVEEIRRWSGLETRPLFVPSVGRFRQGMIVQVPLQLGVLPGAPGPEAVYEALAAHYAGQRFVTMATPDEAAALVGAGARIGLNPEGLNGTNELRLYVFGQAEHGHAVVMALIDNLGKGASGQAVQNLNLMLGVDESVGLEGEVNTTY